MQQASKSYAKLNALILIGGTSKRMGSDKSVIDYHGKPQWEHLVDLLQNQVDKIYISARPNQQITYPNIITDKEAGLGPFGAILSALDSKPGEAFLVIATDLPYIDKTTIKLLIRNRDLTKSATALKAKNKDYPEPLATIWEPKSLAVLKNFYENKIYKPIQILKEIPLKTITVNDAILENINTESEYLQVKDKLNKKCN